VVLSVVLLMASAWLVMPSLLKSQGETRLSDLLGRAVSIDQVDSKPRSLELTVRQLQIAGLANVALLAERALVFSCTETARLGRGQCNVVSGCAIGADRQLTMPRNAPAPSPTIAAIQMN